MCDSLYIRNQRTKFYMNHTLEKSFVRLRRSPCHRVFFLVYYINSLPSSHHTFDLNHLRTFRHIFQARPIQNRLMAYRHNSIRFATEVLKIHILLFYKSGDISESSCSYRLHDIRQESGFQHHQIYKHHH